MILQVNAVDHNGSFVCWTVLSRAQRNSSLKRWLNLRRGVLWPHLFLKLGSGLHIGAFRDATQRGYAFRMFEVPLACAQPWKGDATW